MLRDHGESEAEAEAEAINQRMRAPPTYGRMSGGLSAETEGGCTQIAAHKQLRRHSASESMAPLEEKRRKPPSLFLISKMLPPKWKLRVFAGKRFGRQALSMYPGTSRRRATGILNTVLSELPKESAPGVATRHGVHR